jgi:hypothetical protein
VPVVTGRDQHRHPAGEPPHRERDGVRAGLVEPLQVVDRHQYRRIDRQPPHDRQKRCRDGSRIGGCLHRIGSKQHVVQRESLRIRQLGPGRSADSAAASRAAST